MSTKNYLAKRPEIVWVMAATCAFAIANVYYNQPLLAVIGQSFHVSVQQVGFIPMLTQIGFATGLLLIIPLGDVMERRQLIVTLSAATACALAAAAISPNLLWLVVSSGVIGVTTNIPMLIVPFAAQLAGSKEQGKVVGIVMGGLLIGILLARTVSGFIAASLGWRAMYWIAAGLMIALAVVVAALLPKSQPSSKLSYYQLMHSLPGLIQRATNIRRDSICCKDFNLWLILLCLVSISALLQDNSLSPFVPLCAGSHSKAPSVARILHHRRDVVWGIQCLLGHAGIFAGKATLSL